MVAHAGLLQVTGQRLGAAGRDEVTARAVAVAKDEPLQGRNCAGAVLPGLSPRELEVSACVLVRPEGIACLPSLDGVGSVLCPRGGGFGEPTTIEEGEGGRLDDPHGGAELS